MIEKIFSGVLRVLTPLGPRYVSPTIAQRIYLIWLFRNFPTLSPQVLSRRQQHHLERLCNERGFVPLGFQYGTYDAPILGTLERRLTSEAKAENGPEKMPVASAVRPMDGLRQRS